MTRYRAATLRMSHPETAPGHKDEEAGKRKLPAQLSDRRGGCTRHGGSAAGERALHAVPLGGKPAHMSSVAGAAMSTCACNGVPKHRKDRAGESTGEQGAWPPHLHREPRGRTCCPNGEFDRPAPTPRQGDTSRYRFIFAGIPFRWMFPGA